MAADPRSSPLALTVLGLLHYQPLHPYGVQRLIRQWGKDDVVNVGQRTSLYRTMRRLEEAGLIAARGSEREQAYPERTVYEVTEAGRAAARRWIEQMLSTPRQEFPVFPAALSNLLLLTPEEMAEFLGRRITALAAEVARLDDALGTEDERGLPRIAMLETEYVRAVTIAELRWLEGVRADLAAGRLSWSVDQLTALAETSE